MHPHTGRRALPIRPSAARTAPPALAALVALAAVTAVAALCLPRAARAAAGDGGAAPLVVCVDASQAPDGLDAASLRTAVTIEARKAGVPLLPCSSATLGSERVVWVALHAAPAPRAVVTLPDGVRRTVDVAAVPAVDRAGEVARAVVAPAGRPPGIALDARAAAPLPASPGAAAPEPALGVEAALGGRFDLGLGGDADRSPALEAELALRLDDRWAVGLQGAWTPERVWDGATELQAGSLAVIARPSFLLGATELRPGLGLGLEWRRYAWSGALESAAETLPDGSITWTSQPAAWSDRSVASLVFADLEASWRVADWLRAGTVVGVRVFPTGRAWRSEGLTSYEPSRVALSLGLRLGGRW